MKNRRSFFCSPKAKFFGGVYTSPPPTGGRYSPYGEKRIHNKYAKGTWDNWSAGRPNVTTPGFEVLRNTSDVLGLSGLSGDSWTTYSLSKNLAFFYFIGRYATSDTTSTSCVSVAATAPEKLETGEWDYPAVCLSDLNADQGAILHVDATNTFYSVAKRNNDILLQAFDNCENAPGPTYGCPRTAMETISGANALQIALAENPCTHNLILAYRKDNQIRLRFYDENLKTISEYVVRSNQPFNQGQTNFGCTKGTILRCGNGTSDCCASGDCDTDAPGTCLRVNGRPSIDTYERNVGGGKTCGAVVAYDALMKASDGHDWSKSRLDVVDITNETSPNNISSWNS